MLFSSMIFLWCFLPMVLIGNRIITIYCSRQNRLRYKNIFLLVCSLFFYAWGNISYALIMLASIGINYIGGYFVEKGRVPEGSRKRNLILVIVLNLTILFVFKYFNMVIDLIENIMDRGILGIFHGFLYTEGTGKLGLMRIVLPIGISFFTFQSMSYVIDVYMGKAALQTKLIDFALYVSFFPQLIAGPIVKYSDIAEQLRERRETTSLVVEGQRRFIWGLSKKVLIANTFGNIADEIWKLEIASLGGPMAWLAMISYTFQIYYDFSGYSDMAIGIGKMLGFHFKENFNHPYMATSIQDFWRRWHISLSSWFKEYVYIPLGGSREGLKKTCRNTAIVFFLTGVWHGANFTFLMWGLFYAALLIAERCFLGDILKKNPIKPLNWLYTMFMVMIAWVFFRSDNIAQGFAFIGQLFHGIGVEYTVFSYLSMEVILLFIAAVLFAGPVPMLLGSAYERARENYRFLYVDFGVQLILLALCILKLASGTYNAFIYFQF